MKDFNIHVGKIRYAYGIDILSINEARNMVNEIGGLFGSDTYNIYNDRAYSLEASNDMLTSLFAAAYKKDVTILDNSIKKLVPANSPHAKSNQEFIIFHRIQPLVDEAFNITKDKSYRTGGIITEDSIRYLWNMAMLDIAIVSREKAICYLNFNEYPKISNEIPHLTRDIENKIITKECESQKLSQAIIKSYEASIQKHQQERKAKRTKQLRAILMHAQGCTWEDIGDEIDIGIHNVKAYAREGQKYAEKELKLPHLLYMP